MLKHTIRRPAQPKACLFDHHPPIIISKEEPTLRVPIIEEVSPFLPDDVEQRVDENWGSFVAEKPKAVDNPVAYILDYHKNPDGIEIKVHLAGFRYNQYFNRDDYEMRDSRFADLGMGRSTKLCNL